MFEAYASILLQTGLDGRHNKDDIGECDDRHPAGSHATIIQARQHCHLSICFVLVQFDKY